MYFLVNASPSKPLDLSTLNYVAAKSYDVEGSVLYFA